MQETLRDNLIELGVSVTDAKTFIDCLITADSYGVLSHGTGTLPAHIERIKNGGYNLNPDIKVIKETSAFAVIDGDNALGPVSAEFCMGYAAKKCKESGVFTVFARNNNTFGPAFYYPLQIARQGLIGFVCSNSPAQMAAMGGRDKMLGTNPFSCVIPLPDSEPIIIDMATSAVAKSKIKQFKEQGKKIPEGWATDINGLPTTDPETALSGLVLPMADFKGYSIAMLIDIIAGALSGAAVLNGVGQFYGNSQCMNVGYYMVAIDPEVVFGEAYSDMIKNYVATVRNSHAAQGKKILLPGDDRIEYKNTMGQV